MGKKLRQFFVKHLLKDEFVIEKVIERLKELNYLNDSQYAKDYISDRIRFKPRSKFLLKRELSLKGISPEVSAEILDDSGADEFEMAIQLLRKRGFFDSENLSQKEQAKYCRFLASKGFNKEIIYKSLKSQYNCD